MTELAVTLGIILSLFSMETLGLAAGGIVVPGYVALLLDHPDRMIGLVMVALATFLTLKLIGKFTFLFGRRQMVVALLVGTIFAIISHHFFTFNTSTSTVQFSALGWVVPGLIAHWGAKQGFFKTISMLALVSVIIRLLVIMIYNGNPLPYH